MVLDKVCLTRSAKKDHDKPRMPRATYNSYGFQLVLYYGFIVFGMHLLLIKDLGTSNLQLRLLRMNLIRNNISSSIVGSCCVQSAQININ